VYFIDHFILQKVIHLANYNCIIKVAECYKVSPEHYTFWLYIYMVFLTPSGEVLEWQFNL
jgi:hypothetical protein